MWNWPNDPKLSDGRLWRDRCAAEARWRLEAAGVTQPPVRCSAWLDAGCWKLNLTVRLPSVGGSTQRPKQFSLHEVPVHIWLQAVQALVECAGESAEKQRHSLIALVGRSLLKQESREPDGTHSTAGSQGLETRARQETGREETRSRKSRDGAASGRAKNRPAAAKPNAARPR